MNRNVVVILFIAVLVGVISVFYYYIKQYSPKYSWTENYKRINDQPYGLKVFYELLEEENDITVIKSAFNDKLDTSVTNSSYIVFGNHLYIDSLRAVHILKFVKNGNSALIASNGAPLEITRMLLPETDTIRGYDFPLDSLVMISFKNKSPEEKLSLHYQFLKDTLSCYWGVYDTVYFNDTLSNYEFEAVSFLNNKVNCYSFNWGKGKVIIHSNPILFTNYNIIQKDGFKNINKILSNLNSGAIYWDEISQKPAYEFNQNGLPTGNPLQFLFSHYTLRWGWYLFLITILIYLLFRTKREQRIIPILPKNINSTIEYTKAIGVLYFQKGQHKLIANEMHLILLADLRSRYNIVTTIEEPELISQVSVKSGIKEDVITKLFRHFRKVRFSPMANSKDLINLHNAVEFYYKNCN